MPLRKRQRQAADGGKEESKVDRKQANLMNDEMSRNISLSNIWVLVNDIGLIKIYPEIFREVRFSLALKDYRI